MSNKITISKGHGISQKTNKEYDFYEIKVGSLYSTRVYPSSLLEKAYLDKFIQAHAHEEFDKDDSDDEDDLEKGLDGLFN